MKKSIVIAIATATLFAGSVSALEVEHVNAKLNIYNLEQTSIAKSSLDIDTHSGGEAEASAMTGVGQLAIVGGGSIGQGSSSLEMEKNGRHGSEFEAKSKTPSSALNVGQASNQFDGSSASIGSAQNSALVLPDGTSQSVSDNTALTANNVIANNNVNGFGGTSGNGAVLAAAAQIGGAGGVAGAEGGASTDYDVNTFNMNHIDVNMLNASLHIGEIDTGHGRR